MRVQIPNHYTHKLSELDLLMVKAVPPGGNWKNIPHSIPSKRLQQIRESFAAGKGSRSTYYGRLQPDKPSYTINTYFNRPGNGCFIHYDHDGGQHRLISQREAARLQSFPDFVVFRGSKSSVNKQIGNAVPPLLAFQLAQSFGDSGCFVDLFCGAGGLGLGFKWAGWTPLVANDIETSFLETYADNVHTNVIPGDIRDEKVFDEIITLAKKLSVRKSSLPLFLLGGPPCQGFSTAGKRRSMRDKRNSLFEEFRKALLALGPDGFIFENVPGILNMHGGKIFNIIYEQLGSIGYDVSIWKLQAEQYGIPQRRTRVFMLGLKPSLKAPSMPPPVTWFNKNVGQRCFLPSIFSVKESLDDLPPLQPGEDGSTLEYKAPPGNPYTHFVRGELSAKDYIEGLTRGVEK